MPGQPDDADVMAEILAAELGADPHVLAHLEDRFLHFEVAERLPLVAAFGGQRVEIVTARQLDRLQVEFGRRPADDDGQVIGRASGGAERTDFFVQEGEQFFRVQHRRGFLEQIGLVGGATALGDEQELIGVARFRVEFDLPGQVGARIGFLIHRNRRNLAVAQVALGIGPQNAVGNGGFVVAAGPDLLPFLAHDDRRARILAHGQDTACRDIGVLQQVEGDETVIVRRFRVVEDFGELPQVVRAQQVVDIAEGLLRQQGKRLGIDLQDRLAVKIDRTDVIAGQLAIRRLVGAHGKHCEMRGIGHVICPLCGGMRLHPPELL